MIGKHSLVSYQTMIETARNLASEDRDNSEYDRALTELIANCFGIEKDEVTKDVWPYVATFRCALYFDVKTQDGDHPLQAQVVNGLLRALPEFFGSRAPWMDELEEIEASSDPTVLPDSTDLPPAFWSTYVTIEVPT